VRRATVIITIFNGYAVFLTGGWNTSDFIVAYVQHPSLESRPQVH
jgi:amino acid permease